jgi:uncharacterized linocin/CFP29 family protein
MNVLKRELAPISSKAWAEIDGRAREILNYYLSARKFVNVQGPKGLDFTSVTEGRIQVHSDPILNYGIFKVKPLVEPRVSFILSRWELDNIERGAKDINFDALDEAVKKMALFEEKVIFQGLQEADISGIFDCSSHDVKVFGDSDEDILASISHGIMELERSIAPKPYTLVVSEDYWCKLSVLGRRFPLIDQIKSLTGGDVVVSRSIEGAVLLPFDNDNIEFSIGEDFSIGYQEHSESEVKLFITETFTFRILDESFIVIFK